MESSTLGNNIEMLLNKEMQQLFCVLVEDKITIVVTMRYFIVQDFIKSKQQRALQSVLIRSYSEMIEMVRISILMVIHVCSDSDEGSVLV